MENDVLLYLFRATHVLAEKQRICEWSFQAERHNQAFMQGLKACATHLDDIKNSPFFKHPDFHLQYDILRQIKNLALMMKLFDESPLMPDSGPSVTYQIPTEEDLIGMRGMYAGGTQDQAARIRKLVKTLKTQVEAHQVTETLAPACLHWVDRIPWQVLCEAIQHRDSHLVNAAFKAIPANDPVLKALLKVHDESYLLSLIHACTQLAPNKTKKIDTDVLCGHKTFEILIHDLITTLEQRQQFNVCLGLPTHHADRGKGAGFCLINKLAVVMVYEELTAPIPFHAVFIGTDVNRDNGLNRFLMAETTTQPSTHLDIHDSRVYPFDDYQTLLACMGTPTKDDAFLWKKGTKCYDSIDLASNPRGRRRNHPALHYVLTRLEDLLINAAKMKEPVLLFLPTGWDSHEQEEAICGKQINQDYMLDKKEAHRCRFSDEDFIYFNEKMLALCRQYPDVLTRIYWQLEGGYTEQVNVRQLSNLIGALQAHYPKVVKAEEMTMGVG